MCVGGHNLHENAINDHDLVVVVISNFALQSECFDKGHVPSSIMVLFLLW